MSRASLRFLLPILVLVAASAVAHADASKLDPRARVALSRLRSTDAIVRGQVEVSALTPTGELDAFITGNVTRGQLEALGVKVRTELPGIFTADIPEDAVDAVAALPGVTGVHGAAPVEYNNNVGTVASGASALRGPGPNFTGLNGAGVLVADVDTGVDYDHGDFLDAGGLTRFVNVWDQTDAVGPNPSGYAYGSEWNPASLNSLAAREKDTNGHGTHVLGTIGGDGSQTGGAIPAFTYTGMAPKADLIMVKTDLTTTRIIDGVAYVFGRATALAKNAVVNLSLGSQFGPHDGTSTFETALTAMTGPGRIIAVSAGNDGATAKHAEVFAAGAGTNATMTISGSALNRIVGIDGYYNGTENINLRITTPNGTVLGPYTLGTINGSYPTGASTANGRVYVENGAFLTATGAREVYIEISPTTGQNMNGTWTFTFIPVTLGAANGEVDLWRYYTSNTAIVANFVTGNQPTEELVSEPGNALGVITTAAYAPRVNWQDCTGATINFTPVPALGSRATFSSQGPTRDGRQKPDITADGWAVGSTRSFDIAISCTTPSVTLNDGINHVMNSGTSMASPHTAGAAALLMQKYGAVTPAFIKSYLNSHAIVDAQTGVTPNKDWGGGKLFLGDLVDPTVTVLTANGGETVVINSPLNITWNAADNVGVTTVDVLISRDGGANYSPIATAIPNSGSYNWLSTYPASNTCRIKVVANDANGNNGSDISDADFYLIDPVTPTLMSMMAAETIGDGIEVRWQLSDALANAPTTLERGTSFDGPFEVVTAQMSTKDGIVSAIDRSVEAGHTYFYRVVVAAGSRSLTFGPIEGQAGLQIADFALGRVTPTPTNSLARVDYALPREAQVRLSVVDVQGREAALLLSGNQRAGRYQAVWNGETTKGGRAAAGLYFVRLQVAGRTFSSRVVLAK